MSSYGQPPRRNDLQFKFKDDVRSIDFILAYKLDWELEKYDKRAIFESNLEKKGLELEHDEPEEGFELRFVKIHAPMDVCREYCEKLKLNMPTKELQKVEDPVSSSSNWWDAVLHRLSQIVPDYDHRSFSSTRPDHPTAVYSRDAEQLFDISSTDFFTPAVRATIVEFILNRTSFSANDTEPHDFGIDQAYFAAYPLHQGYCNVPGTPRHALYRGWASLGNIFRRQPLDHIEEYFGAEIALYFSWLGFYTYMLIFPAIVSSMFYVYSWIISRDCSSCAEFCTEENNATRSANNTQLRNRCTYCANWEIRDACLVNTRPAAHVFAGWMIVVFTIFMCIWSTVFVELWTQYSAGVTQRWNVRGSNERAQEHVRPEQLKKLGDCGEETVNPITNETEPKTRSWARQLPITLLRLSSAIILIYISLLGVRLTNEFLRYLSPDPNIRLLSTKGLTYASKSDDCDWRDRLKDKFSHVTPTLIRLVTIATLYLVYTRLARRFTSFESHRTQNEYDDSLTQKLYLFNFINYYWSVLRIVFLRAKLFIGLPGDLHLFLLPTSENERRKDEIVAAEEVCGLDGCLADLHVELFETMIYKQALNALKEYSRPFLQSIAHNHDHSIHLPHSPTKLTYLLAHRPSLHPRILINCWWSGRAMQKANGPNLEHGDAVKSKQWISDSKLQPFGPQAMFPEYIEMVVQFGFVMLFTCAFPLAPLFALLNNIFEVRLDAKKIIAFYRRPTPPPTVKCINIWHKIMDLIIILAIFTNSFIIAFLSDIIPKTIHYMLKNDLRRRCGHDNNNCDVADYLEFSLSYGSVSEIGKCAPRKIVDECDRLTASRPLAPCWMQFLTRDFSAWSEEEQDIHFWIFLAARFLFMIVFQNFLTVLVSLVRHYVRSKHASYDTISEGKSAPGEATNQFNEQSSLKQRVIIETQV